MPNNVATDSDSKQQAYALHVETSQPTAQSELAIQHTAYEKSLSFWETLRIYWRATLWILYGQLVVFGYGIDGIIAGYLLAIPRFRYVSSIASQIISAKFAVEKIMENLILSAGLQPTSYLQPGSHFMAESLS